jgi:micrococcal nuclease
MTSLTCRPLKHCTMGCCSTKDVRPPRDVADANKNLPVNEFFSSKKDLPADPAEYTQFKWAGAAVPCRVLSVYDGDTVTLGFRSSGGMLYTIKGRLEGIDTPELKGKSQEEKELAHQAKAILEKLILGKEVTAYFVCNDKYGGRAVVRLYTDKWESVSTYMLTHAPCRPYSGGTKSSWP